MAPSTTRPTSSAGLQSISGHLSEPSKTNGSSIGMFHDRIRSLLDSVHSALPPPADPSSPKPEPIPCALKVLDLDSLAPHPLSLLQRETTLMSLSKHPNVIRVRGTWTEGHKLYIAMRLMNKGSAADVMRYGWPEAWRKSRPLRGFFVLTSAQRRGFQAQEHYDGLGSAGGDSRASSLINDQQHVAGKRVVLVDSHIHSGLRWANGSRLLVLYVAELHFSDLSRTLQSIQEDPPALDRDGGTFKYSRAFKEVIDSCLIKDPSKRPTAEQLLQTPFFKSAKKPSYLVAAILSAFFITLRYILLLIHKRFRGLTPLTQRQERQAIASAQIHRTVESWDFAATVHTPTTSVYRRRLQDDSDHSHHLGSDEDVSLIDMDQHRSHSSLSGRAHNKGVLWHDDTEVVEEDPEEDVDSAPGTSPSGESTSERVFTEEEAHSTSPPRDEKPSSLVQAVALPTTRSTGFWDKLKGVRRPSSRGGSENLSEKKEKVAGGPDAPKEKKPGAGL
ncbi:Serine/threonine-protein kinase [Salix suchowensis]|nr:Serine/threonine-protein kinase [Salix suchowensis]